MAYIANSLVSKAKKADKAGTAMEVLRVAVAKKPAVCVSVVSFICSLVPDAAADIAAEAVKLTPEYTREIARAAAKAAPAQIDKITIALLKATKAKKHQMVYNSVVAAVPSLFRTVNQAVLAGGGSDSKGVITTVGNPRLLRWVPMGAVADASITIPGVLPRHRLPRLRVSTPRVTTLLD